MKESYTAEEFMALRHDRRKVLARAYRRLHGCTHEEAHEALRAHGASPEVVAERRRSKEHALRTQRPERNIPKRDDGCMVCGAVPYLSESLMCGPCTFGTADAIGEGDLW